jgi:hypothetical protein
MSEERKTETTNLAAQHFAEWYMRFWYPRPYSRPHYYNGKRVIITAEEYTRPDDTQPVYGVREPDEPED